MNGKQQLAAQVANLEAENRRLEDAAVRTDAASERYDACLADAQIAYDARWNKTCRILKTSDLREVKFCRSNGGSDEYCSSLEVGLAKDCSLPIKVADTYDVALKQEQRFCMDRLKLGR